ncbi:uncharacterized protein LOC129925329 [Biomphalaria glabrata]|uniref:Uncharacterized protein LOC129925329 n=2 Tax=Biomphalaria TaxID=6525 RepID=A0A9W3A1C4_BIOGL|nr:uncharacterized protein LOC129925329 [Biomphalaria glabrata]
MNHHETVVLLALASLCVISATPLSSAIVEPVAPLDQMAPDHACLFLCNVCFHEQDAMEELMLCSNTVCGPVMEGTCAMDKFLWLGRHCRHYGDVERLWSFSAKH